MSNFEERCIILLAPPIARAYIWAASNGLLNGLGPRERSYSAPVQVGPPLLVIALEKDPDQIIDSDHEWFMVEPAPQETIRRRSSSNQAGGSRTNMAFEQTSGPSSHPERTEFSRRMDGTSSLSKGQESARATGVTERKETSQEPREREAPRRSNVEPEPARSRTQSHSSATPRHANVGAGGSHCGARSNDP